MKEQISKFQEMRLRAVKFQDITGCELTIYHKDQSIRLSIFDYVENEDGTETKRDFKAELRTTYYSGTPLPDSIIEDDIKAVEERFEARFPSLLEAQGWIAVEDGLPKHAQNIAFYSQGTWGEFKTYYGYYDERFGGFVSHTDAYVGSPLYWKPLDEFPQA